MSPIPFPDFITRAKRELMLSAVFLAFFVGAIVALKEALEIPVCIEALRTVWVGDELIEQFVGSDS